MAVKTMAIGFRQRGFNLVELMATLAIAGILFAGVVPSLGSILLNQGVKTVSFDLMSAMLYTRSEAIKRNRPVTLRPEGGDWHRPWFLCAAPDVAAPDLVRGRCAADEVELGLQEWVPPDTVSLDASPSPAVQSASAIEETGSSVTSVTFCSDGRASTGILFTVCSATAHAEVAQRLIRLDVSGRANVRQGNSCGSS
jgi:type IV fimbrial biogenesis protein FimT